MTEVSSNRPETCEPTFRGLGLQYDRQSTLEMKGESFYCTHSPYTASARLARTVSSCAAQAGSSNPMDCDPKASFTIGIDKSLSPRQLGRHRCELCKRIHVSRGAQLRTRNPKLRGGHSVTIGNVDFSHTECELLGTTALYLDQRIS